MSEEPYLATDDATLQEARALMAEAFAYMDGVVDPPSSIHRLTLDDLRRADEVWVLGHPVRAAVVLTVRPEVLYLGKLAVDADHRGMGYARRLVEKAAARARALGLARLELQTRIELIDNHETFRRLGFTKVGETAHPGFTRSTSITMQKIP